MIRAGMSVFQTREAELRARLSQLDPSTVRREREAIEHELRSLQMAATREPRVSDHALLRYCERVLGADLVQIRNQILSEVGPAVSLLGAGKFPLKGGGVAIVRDSMVVTIIGREGDRE